MATFNLNEYKQALVAATINAAFATGQGDAVGSLEGGKQADAVILDVPDYRHLRHLGYRFGTNLVYTVIKRGQVVVNPLQGRGGQHASA